jgi:hypothetical protein
MSVALSLFQQLCEVGNALEELRDAYVPGSDDWTALTEILGILDLAIDGLVYSHGIGGADDADP